MQFKISSPSEFDRHVGETSGKGKTVGKAGGKWKRVLAH